MKRAISILIFLFITKLSFGQKQLIVGAWYWSDSTKETSMFFNQDGSLQTHSGSKGEAILTKNLKNGTFVLTSGLLIIKWADSNVEKDKIKFIDKNRFVLIVGDKNKKNEMIFRRVVDEEVIEVK
jgi:hypothetical protein